MKKLPFLAVTHVGYKITKLVICIENSKIGLFPFLTFLPPGSTNGSQAGEMIADITGSRNDA